MDPGVRPEWSSVRSVAIALHPEDEPGCYVGHLPRTIPKSSEWAMRMERAPTNLLIEVTEPSTPEGEPFLTTSRGWARMRPVLGAWRKLRARIRWLTGEPFTGGALVIHLLIAWLTDVVA
jgi:hypothetical protein